MSWAEDQTVLSDILSVVQIFDETDNKRGYLRFGDVELLTDIEQIAPDICIIVYVDEHGQVLPEVIVIGHFVPRQLIIGKCRIEANATDFDLEPRFTMRIL